MDSIANDYIVVNADEDSVFFDLSYFIFHRYYSIFNWYKKSQPTDQLDVSTILENPTFMGKYDKLFEKNIVDIVKTCKVNWRYVYLIKDCPRDEIWRHTLYHHYKETRDERLETFNRDIFRHTYGQLIPALQTKYKFNIVSHPKLEADDVIALLKFRVRDLNSSVRIVIITNDNDYIQLSDSNTTIQNLAGRNICLRVGMNPALYLETKCILGDKSDNIPSIMKKIGPKTAEKLADSKENFAKFCQKHPEAERQYQLNRCLIDFTNIPQDLKEAFYNRVTTKTT
jgi:5'-3' exonuclease